MNLRARSGRNLVGFDGVALVPMGTDRDTDTGLRDNNNSARTNDYEEANVETAAAAAAKR